MTDIPISPQVLVEVREYLQMVADGGDLHTRTAQLLLDKLPKPPKPVTKDDILAYIDSKLDKDFARTRPDFSFVLYAARAVVSMYFESWWPVKLVEHLEQLQEALLNTAPNADEYNIFCDVVEMAKRLPGYVNRKKEETDG